MTTQFMDVNADRRKLDEDRIKERLLYIEDQLAVLLALRDDINLMESLPTNKLAHGGALYALQTSIQAMLDIGFHLCAKLYLTAPETSAQVFEILAEHGDIPPYFLTTARNMVSFRNLVVRGYLHTKPNAVGQIIRENLDDFALWKQIVLVILSRNETTP